jgi:hypothetical protein
MFWGDDPFVQAIDLRRKSGSRPDPQRRVKRAKESVCLNSYLYLTDWKTSWILVTIWNNIHFL